MKEPRGDKPATALADQRARDRIQNDLDTTLVVEAAAGTGKTSALIGRILSGVISGQVRLAKLGAVTFTDFAAGELRLRLRSEIEKTRQQQDASSETMEFPEANFSLGRPIDRLVRRSAGRKAARL